jgi:hypothetical protein
MREINRIEAVGLKEYSSLDPFGEHAQYYEKIDQVMRDMAHQLLPFDLNAIVQAAGPPPSNKLFVAFGEKPAALRD